MRAYKYQERRMLVEFLYSICDSDEEFLIIGYTLNTFLNDKGKANRFWYVPRYLSNDRLENYRDKVYSKKLSEVSILQDVFESFTPNNSFFKINEIIISYGGQRIYIPYIPEFHRIIRNQKIKACRNKGYAFSVLSDIFNLSQSAIRNIVKIKKTG